MVDRPPTGPGWLYEVNHDGFRVLTSKQGEQVKNWSRRGADFTYRFPTIVEAVRGLACDSALIDGEAVVLRNDGWSDFGALMTKRGGTQASLGALAHADPADVAPAFRQDAILAVGRLPIQGEGLVHRTVTAVWRTYFQPRDAVEAHGTRSRRDAHAEDD